MAGHQKDPLRPLTPDDRLALEQVSRSHTAPAAEVARAKEVLAVPPLPGRVKKACEQHRYSGIGVLRILLTEQIQVAEYEGTVAEIGQGCGKRRDLGAV